MALLDNNHILSGLTIQMLNPAAPSFYPALVNQNYELPALPHPNTTIANIIPPSVDTALLTFFHHRRHQPQLCSPSSYVQYFAYGYTSSPFQYTHFHPSQSHFLRTSPQPPSQIQYDRNSTLQLEPSSFVMSSSYTRQPQSTTPRPARCTPTHERKTDWRNSFSSNGRHRSRKEKGGGVYCRNSNISNGRDRSRKEVSEGSTGVDNTSTKMDTKVTSCGSSTTSSSSTPCHASSGREYQRRNQSMGYQDVVPVEKDGRETTVMIRNIPNRYVREELMQFIDNHCLEENQKEKAIHTSDAAAPEKEAVVSAFDFLYLPMDFGTGLNKGYAFVNFTNPRAVWKFQLACNGHTWRHYSSNKRIHVACAKLQGKRMLVKHFEPKTFPSDHCLPVSFSPALDGSNTQSVHQTIIGSCSKGRSTQEWRKRN